MLRSAQVFLALAFGALATTACATEKDGAGGRNVPVNGIELHYQEWGVGKPLVLLHGFGGCGADWQPFVAGLSKGHRLIVVDLRGHGHSTNPADRFTMRQSANDVYALLDALGIGRFSAMGISAGGMTLLHMATQQPARVQSMVLIGATSYFPEQARSIMRDATVESLPPEVREEFASCATRGEEQVRQLVAQFHGFNSSYDDMNFTGPYLSTITARTLIVHGDRDPFFPVEIPVGMYRSIPNSELWIVPGGDHVPIYDPAVPFADTALRFIDATGQK